MTAIIDYGVGNLFSLVSSFSRIGEEAQITADKEIIEKADRIILPGVGAFCDAAEKLRNSGLVPVLMNEIKKGKPVLGICLGMQLLFEKSYEYGEHEGLSLLKGVIKPISAVAENVKIPHMGWNSLSFTKGAHPLFKYIKEGDYVYFVHSFFASNCDDSVIAETDYGAPLTAACAKKNIMGCQFHPEKSGEVGLNILRAFCEMKEGAIC